VTQLDLKSDPVYLKDMTAKSQVNYSVARDSLASFNFSLGANLYPPLRCSFRQTAYTSLTLPLTAFVIRL